MAKFGDIRLPSFDDLPKSRQNLYRFYFVDGTLVQIEKDGNEADYNYRYRCSFALARLANSDVSIEELGINGRIAANKRWAPTIKDDDTGAYVQTPYYPDIVEDQYRKVRALPAMDITSQK
jgi:hypothetical protein